MLNKAVIDGAIKGFSVCCRSPAIKGGPSSARYLKFVLDAYEKASGRKIIFQKSTLCYNPTMQAFMRESILNTLQVPIVENFEKYLGLPTFVGKNT